MVNETGSSTVSNTLSVTVNPIPLANNIVSDPEICASQTGNIVVTGAAAGISYQLRLNGINTLIGSAVSSGPGGNVSLPLTPTSSNTYNVYASNEYTCGIQLSDLANVTVRPATIITAQSTPTQTQCNGDAFAAMSVTATGQGTLTYQWYSNTSAVNSGGTAVAGATSASYTPLSTTDGTLYYYCEVTGGCGPAASNISGAIVVTHRPSTGDLYRKPNN
jgi:hypothetical protein